MEKYKVNDEEEIVNGNEEMHEFLGKCPSVFSRRTLIILGSIFVSLLTVTWLVKYPHVVSGDVTINANNAVIKLVAPVDGRIRIVAKSGTLKTDDLIAYISNSAKLKDVLILSDRLKKFDPLHSNFSEAIRQFSDSLELGEISRFHSTFRKQLIRAYLYETANTLREQILTSGKVLEQQQTITIQRKLITELKQKSLAIALSSYIRDSTLFHDKVITFPELERSKQFMLNTLSEVERINAEVIQSRIEEISLEKKKDQMILEDANRQQEILSDLNGAHADLQSAIREWETRYLIKSPTNGQLEHLRFWSENQFVPAGAELFGVTPAYDSYFAEVRTPSQGMGKVTEGQKVLINLEDFPYNEYGYLIGKVSSISTIKTYDEEKKSYTLLKVSLPPDLITNLKVPIKFKHGMKGTGEIVTGDKRLVNRVFETIKVVFAQ
jgi:hypothetical protein